MIETHEMEINGSQSLMNTAQKQLLNLWLQSPIMDNRLDYIIDKLMVCIPAEHKNKPVIIFKGENSMARHQMGTGWQEELEGITNADKIYELYQQCYENRVPRLEYVSMKNFNSTDFAYERLVLPFKTRKGVPMLINFSYLTMLSGVSLNQPSLDNLVDPLTLERIPLLLGSGASPIKSNSQPA